MPFWPTNRPSATSEWSSATWLRRPTANGWRWTGSTSRAMPTLTVIRPTSSATCRRGATGSSARSTRICPTINSSSGRSPATCCRTPRATNGWPRLSIACIARRTKAEASRRSSASSTSSDRVNTFGTAILGLTLECARCHDHKFDPDHAARLLLAVRVLQQHRRIGTVFALHARHAHADACCSGRTTAEAARQIDAAQIAASEAELDSDCATQRTPISTLDGDRPTAKCRRRSPIAHFTFDAVTATRRHDRRSSNADQAAPSWSDGPQLVRRPRRQGARVQRRQRSASATGCGAFRRTDAFSFSLWLKPTETTGPRGGAPSFAGVDGRGQPRISNWCWNTAGHSSG